MRKPCAVRGDTSENLIELLERRLDAVVYRLKFAVTPFAARQFVSHAHLMVNGRKVNIASYLVNNDDVIEVRDKSKQLAVVLDAAPEFRARRAGIYGGRSSRDEGPLPACAQADRRALPGADGAEPRRRILFALRTVPAARRIGRGARGRPFFLWRPP